MFTTKTIKFGRTSFKPVIKCNCGCNALLLKYDRRHRVKLYLQGHASRNRYLSDETKTKISKSNSGENNGMYGAIPWNKDKKMSEEYCENIKNGWTEEKRKKVSIKQMNRVVSEETKIKMKPTMFKKDHIPWNKNGHHTEESKQKLREARKNQKNVYISKPEKLLGIILSVNGVKYKKHKAFKIGDSWHQVDFFIKPNIIIEEDGDYWHANPDHLKQHKGCPNYLFSNNGKIITSKQIWDKDRLIDKTLKKQGYKVIRIWEHEIYENPLGCLETIQGVCNEL